jgi:sugar phosphate isomerase/epimerase
MFNASRRTLLMGIAASGAAAMTGSSALAKQSKFFFARIGRPIGLQTYTLGDEVAADIAGTFAQIAAAGFRELELPSLYGRAPVDIKAAADQAGLKISGLHLSVSTRGNTGGLSLSDDPAKIAESVVALGARRVTMPILPFPADMRRLPDEDPKAMIVRTLAAAGPDHYRRTAEQLNAKGAALAPLGIRLSYHNHNLEFAPMGKTTGWDILVTETDPGLVDFEFDIGWALSAGLDPVDMLTKLRGRVKQVHLKDVAAGNRPNFALDSSPVVAGGGVMDWKRVLPALHRAGVEHWYVEQEPPFTMPRIEAVKQSFDFLRRVCA